MIFLKNVSVHHRKFIYERKTNKRKNFHLQTLKGEIIRHKTSFSLLVNITENKISFIKGTSAMKCLNLIAT
jgi:hypothetical protein